MPIEGKTVKVLSLLHLKRTHELFAGNVGQPLPIDDEGQRLKLACKVHDEYASVLHLEAPAAPKPTGPGNAPQPVNGAPAAAAEGLPAGPRPESRSAVAKLLDAIPAALPTPAGATSTALVVAGAQPVSAASNREIMRVIADKGNSSAAVSRRIASKWPRPVWHAPWRLYRVISGHLGWVKSVAIDPANAFFVTGGADRLIKVWDIASGELKLTLTGHIEQVTGLAISARSPYMFSCGLDKSVKNWDLETNKVIRNYHGHLSGIYSLALHPALEILMSGGRDSVCRVWDVRSKQQVFCLSGHDQTVCSILASATDPQVITGSMDSTIRLWDLRTGKTLSTLTFHKKAVRAMAAHPDVHAFVSASADNIKKFALPNGDFLHNTLTPQRSIVNCLAINHENVMVSGGDSGGLWFWDWESGHCFQQADSPIQPGSLEAEKGIYAAAFDMSGSRLITCEADKTVKMWKEDPDATPQSEPGLPFKPPKDMRRF